jgi:signal transduction histidine kinase/CheY-like chemotaxis protein
LVLEGEGPDFRVLFERVPGSYLVLDPDRLIVAVSDAYLAATMTRREDILGRDPIEVFPTNPEDVDASAVSNFIASIDRVRRLRVSDTMAIQKHDIRRPAEEGGDFEVRYWSPVNSPVLDERGQLRYIIHRVEDVTEFVRLSERENAQEAATSELRERTTRMETEIFRRSIELQKVNEQLRAANTAKNDFISRISHELRTPLTAVLGFSELLSLADLDREQRKWAEMALAGVKRLLLLIDEVLDISRLETGKLAIEIESVPLVPVFNDALALVAPLADEHQVMIATPALPPGVHAVYADRRRLTQVLVNLLSNAIKYNRDRGEVHLTVEARGSAHVRIDITDTGRGIETESLAKLFTPFERLDAAEAGVEGTGLGLAVSRTLVQAMNGTLTAQSTRGEGSTFTIELALDETLAPSALSHKGDPLQRRLYSAERRLLYIEDTAANIMLLKEIARSRPSVRVLTATNGQDGLQLAREHAPHLILLDEHLPDNLGRAILQRLRAEEATRETPVIILSADVLAESPQSLLAAGANAYLTKPLTIRHVLDTIDLYLSN